MYFFNAWFVTLSPLVAGFKSIAAYRGGLNIDPSVSKQDAEEGLQQCLKCIFLSWPCKWHPVYVYQMIFCSQIGCSFVVKNYEITSKILKCNHLTDQNIQFEYMFRSFALVTKFCVLDGNHVRITDKSFGDFIFLRGLEIATSHGIPIQIHTGYTSLLLNMQTCNHYE
jgi:hypothetical protein